MCRVHQHEARALGLGKSGRREHAHTHTVTYQITCGNRSKGPCKEFYLRKPACYVGNPRESFFFSRPTCISAKSVFRWRRPAKPRSGTTVCFSLHFCTVVAICKFPERGRVIFQFNFQHWLWRWELLDTFSGPFTDPFLSGINGLSLHVRCTPQQTSQ